jgi:hypothetical protein
MKHSCPQEFVGRYVPTAQACRCVPPAVDCLLLSHVYWRGTNMMLAEGTNALGWHGRSPWRSRRGELPSLWHPAELDPRMFSATPSAPEVQWAPEPVQTMWRIEKMLTLLGLEPRALCHPARSQSLYRLRYRGSLDNVLLLRYRDFRKFNPPHRWKRAECDHVQKRAKTSEAESLRHMKIKYPTHLKMACRPKHVVKDNEN